MLLQFREPLNLSAAEQQLCYMYILHMQLHDQRKSTYSNKRHHFKDKERYTLQRSLYAMLYSSSEKHTDSFT